MAPFRTACVALVALAMIATGLFLSKPRISLLAFDGFYMPAVR